MCVCLTLTCVQPRFLTGFTWLGLNHLRGGSDTGQRGHAGRTASADIAMSKIGTAGKSLVVERVFTLDSGLAATSDDVNAAALDKRKKLDFMYGWILSSESGN